MASKKKTRSRPAGILPAGFAWREGRPRWIATPKRRAQGWRGVDLKDAWGRWLSRADAIARAEAIALACDAFDAGEAPPVEFAAFAPQGTARPKIKAEGVRSIGRLLTDYAGPLDEDSDKASQKFRGLGDATRRDYRNKLRRFVEVLAGSDQPDEIRKVRAMDIDVLAPPPPGSGVEFLLQMAYDTLREDAGEHMALGVHAAVSAWLGWLKKPRNILATNPAEMVVRVAVDGRLVTYEWPEIVALVRAADALGMPSIGDAVVFGIDLSWSQQDVLAINWGQIAEGRVRHRRIKTGNAGRPKLLPVGAARLEAIIARRGNVTPLPGAPVVVCELTGERWNVHTFRHEFAKIRAHAARDCPSVASKRFQDLRDTAVTYCYEAGLSLEEICSRTLHDPDSARRVLQKHYGQITQDVSDAAAAKLEARFTAKGWNLDQLLALPAPAPDVKEG